MKALLKKKIKEVKKRMSVTKAFYRYSNKDIGYQPNMAMAYTKSMIRSRSELRTLENLLAEIG